MSKKIITPVNVLIYKTALIYAATFYEAGRSSGMTSQYKTPEAFAKRYMERFLPMVIKNFIEMLKPHSGISKHMKEEISKALLDPVNDPNLMKTKVDTDFNFDLAKIFSKNKITTPIKSNPTKKTVLHR